ncbi:Epidermal growth factor receptor substrate 15 (Protein Eps15) (Protein AF-1p) [Durusdinium trenchii]|uniref:Epidermal growth factor receptor substrate 15 (Protein Eps15) (Protein AF-1p) n=1 Tax=Durusdinium trenchii TaxID=1381693 RepID=A0ABP0S2K7_9DINO
MAGKSAEERVPGVAREDKGAHLAVEEGKQVWNMPILVTFALMMVVGLKWNSFKLEGGVRAAQDVVLTYGWAEKLYQDLGGGMIDGERAANFLMQSGLPMEVLHSIWDLADSGDQGALNREQFFGALRLVAWAQNGHHPEPSLMSRLPPMLPDFALSPPKAGRPPSANSTPTRNSSPRRGVARSRWRRWDMIDWI